MPDHFPILIGDRSLPGDLSIVHGSHALVVFVQAGHGVRQSGREVWISQSMHRYHLSTLLFDPLTAEEADGVNGRADLQRLVERVEQAVEAGVAALPNASVARVGLFAAGTGAAAALVMAARRPELVRAVVSRSGRPDLADELLSEVQAPTLLVVGAADVEGVHINRQALTQLPGQRRIELVPRATRLFQEAGTLEAVARLASEWFETHLRPLDPV